MKKWSLFLGLVLSFFVSAHPDEEGEKALAPLTRDVYLRACGDTVVGADFMLRPTVASRDLRDFEFALHLLQVQKGIDLASFWEDLELSGVMMGAFERRKGLPEYRYDEWSLVMQGGIVGQISIKYDKKDDVTTFGAVQVTVLPLGRVFMEKILAPALFQILSYLNGGEVMFQDKARRSEDRALTLISNIRFHKDPRKNYFVRNVFVTELSPS